MRAQSSFLGLLSWTLFWGLLAVSGAQTGEAAHRHGAARLNLALEDDHRAVLELLAPAADVVGFEREARTAEEKEQLRERLALLEEEMPRMVIFPRGLGCQLTKEEVTLLGPSAKEGGDDGEPAAENPAEGHGHEHGQASKSDHGDEHGHGHEADHSADYSAEHREVLARFDIRCGKPLAGSTVEIAVGTVFPSLGALEVVVLSARGQSGHHLQGGKGKVKL